MLLIHGFTDWQEPDACRISARTFAGFPDAFSHGEQVIPEILDAFCAWPLAMHVMTGSGLFFSLNSHRFGRENAARTAIFWVVYCHKWTSLLRYLIIGIGYNYICHRSIMIVGKTASDIFEQIRLRVQSGELCPGDTLPSVRDLALALDVNRNTVASAYKRLTDAGIAESRGRNGTVIRDNAAPAQQEGTPPGLALIDLAGGNPSPVLLPDMSIALSRIQLKPRLYGEPPVGDAIGRYGRAWFAEDIDVPFELTLSSGAVDAVERILCSYLIGGDRVAVEDPCFLSSISTIRNNRFLPVGVGMDEEGPDTGLLAEQLASGAQAVIITPRAHNPTGWGLSEQRAGEIRELLIQYPQVLVIVDDHFSLLSTCRYHHVIPPTTRHWALVRSTSKFLGPDLRLAFVASDSETAMRLQQRLNAGTNWVSHILQDMVLATLQSAELSASIQQAKEIYHSRRKVLLSALADCGIEISSRHDGLNLWVPLRGQSAPVVMQMAQRGWLVRGGEAFGLSGDCNGLRITVSDLKEESAGIFAETLAALLKH
ncbi:transcriptional regulator PtsJ [Cronobacter dublinensis]